MDATCTIQDSIHVFRLVHKYVSRILGTYQRIQAFLMLLKILYKINTKETLDKKTSESL